jgi:hypothetical protein
LNRFHNEKGQTTIIVALAMTMLVGFVALTVDVGRAFYERAGLQRTADMSAISGAEALKDAPNTAGNVADFYANQNVSVFRPGQNFASTGCEERYVNTALPPAAAPAWAPPPVSCSPPQLFSGNCTNVAGVYSCPQPNPCMDKNGVQYQCVYTRAASRDFHFLFAPVVGAFSGTRILSAQSTAVLGSGAPGGRTLIPWMLRDCPGSKYDGPNWSTLATTANTAYYSNADGITDDRGRCSSTTDGGYQFSANYTDQTRWTDLFAPGGSGTGGNYGGVDLWDQSTSCPPPNSYFPNGSGSGSGGAAYSDFLSGKVATCSIGAGARVIGENGVAAGPTRQAWTNNPCPTSNPGCPNPGRGVTTTCLTGNAATDQDQFNGPMNGAVTVVNALTGEVKINHINPCLIAVLFVVHSSSDPNVTNQSYLGTPSNIPAPLQYQDSACATFNISQRGTFPCVIQRFAPPGTNVTNGGTPLVVRRVAFFYLTQLGDNNTPYAGIFLKAVNNYEESLNGPADPTDSISVVKLVS